jgi:hypothetical protein
MSILVIGDSLSFGSELVDMPEHFGIYGNNDINTNAKVPPSQYAWPSLISKRLNISVNNLSIAGGSNDRIFRLAVNESLKQSYQCVICAWTTIDRFDFSYQGKDLPLTAGVDVSLKFPWFKQYLVDHYDPLKSQQRWLTQLLTLQSFFKQQQQPYLFVKSCDISTNKSLDYLLKEVDTDHCVDWESNMMEWCAGLPHGKYSHFLEQGHQLVANRFEQLYGIRVHS